MKTNYHTHNYRCRHAIGTVDNYVEVAIKNGYVELGISDHAPVPKYYLDRMKFDELEGYFAEIENSQKKYGDKIKILKSLEIEYFSEFKEIYETLLGKVDYLVLGLHGVKDEQERDGFYSSWTIKDKKRVVEYGEYMVEAIKTGYFDYIAHPDLYLIEYKSWDSEAIQTATKICCAAKEMGIPLEINANGIRKSKLIKDSRGLYKYPNKYFWEIAKNIGVDVIIGSDAHDYNYMEDKAMELAREFADEIGINVIKKLKLKNNKSRY